MDSLGRRPRGAPVAPALILGAAAAAAGCAGPRLPPPAVPFPPPQRWEVPLPSAPFSDIASDGASVFVALASGEVLSFESATGGPLWTRNGSEPLRIAANDRALIGVDPRGVVWGLNRETGEGTWKRPTEAGAPLAIALDANRVFVGARFGVVSVDAIRGEARYFHRTDEASDVMVEQDRVVGLEGGRVSVRRRSDGVLAWSRDPSDGPFGRPALLPDGSVVVGSGPRAVRELSPGGEWRWRFRVGAAVVPRAVEVPRPGRGVAFASREGVLYVVSRGGSMTGRVVLPSRPYSDPIAFGRLILVPCFEDEVVAIDPLALRAVARARFPGGFLAPPVVAGRFLVAVVANPTRLVGLALASDGRD